MKHRRPLIIFSLILSLLLVFAFFVYRFFRPYLPHTAYLLGQEKPTSYLILLGNDAEMRANGGFAGSFAKLIVNYPNFDLSFQDIYVPDGQLQGYVAPPAPIQEAFQHGTWQLSNADWEPNFPTAATTLRWFFEKGGEINPDNLVIINLTSIKKVIDIVGSFKVSEYDAQITPDNLYLFLQGKAEVNFFPGSTQKKDALTAVGQSFKNELLHLPLRKKIQVARLLYQDLVNQNIVINSTNQDFQSLLEKHNFAGKLISQTLDTYLLVETNLGANKANAYITRETNHDISFQNGQTSHLVIVNFQNSSPEKNPNPPFHYGGDYITYLRFYLPQNAQNIQVASSSGTILLAGNSSLEGVFVPAKTTISQKFGLTEIGFWQTTPAQNQSTVKLSYTLPISPENYSLTIIKQHGLVSSPQTIKVKDKTFTTKLENDFSLTP